MKKLLALSLAIVMTLSLAACGDNSTQPTSSPATASSTPSATEPSDNIPASTSEPAVQGEDPTSSDTHRAAIQVH